jgi:hypothetical protein
MSRAVLLVLRDALRRAATRIGRALESSEPREPLPDPDEALRQAREQHRRALRASRTPWYYRRPRPLQVPESLRYYEDVHGTEATLRMLTARAKQREGSR